MAKVIQALYEADNGEIHPVKIHPDVLAAQIDAQPNAATRPEYAQVSGSRKSYGLHVRGWNCYRQIQAGANDILIRRRFIPCLIQNDWKDPSRQPGAQLNLGTNTWTIGTYEPEKIR